MYYLTMKGETVSVGWAVQRRELCIPKLDGPLPPEELEKLQSLSFGWAMARVLALLLDSKLSGWDIERCLGRYAIRTLRPGRSLTVVELFDGGKSYSQQERLLFAQLCPNATDPEPTPCAKLAIRIAVLFGQYSALAAETTELILPGEDLYWLCAAMLAKRMGLPAGRLIYGCAEGSEVWALLHRGQLRPDAANAEQISLALWLLLGAAEAEQFRAAREAYTLPEGRVQRLREQVFCACVSRSRAEQVMRSVQQATGYTLGIAAAMGYSGYQDCRIRRGGARPALLLQEEKP